MASLPVDVQCSHTVPARGESARRMALVLGITAVVLAAEAVGGWLAHSLALLADAGHMLADLAALVNGAMLIAIAVGIGIEAWRRFHSPPAVRASLLIAVAAAGLAANLVSARILHYGHAHSLNQRAAYLHVLSDALGAL